jgi:quinol monooxygenase YgiN
MSVVVVATLNPLPEHREAVIKTLEETIARVHQEPGCELYALHEDRDRLVYVEKWESAEALAAHAKGQALADQADRLAGKLNGPADVRILQPHPAGDPAKGAL